MLQPPVNSNPNISDDFSRIRIAGWPSRQRAFHMIIEPTDNHFQLLAMGSRGGPFDPSRLSKRISTFLVDIPLSETEVASAVRDCRDAWRNNVVNLLRDDGLLFQQKWDFRNEPDFRQHWLHSVALAGEALFNAIFFPRSPGLAKDRLKGLNQVGEILREESAKQSMWFIISTLKFNVPWNLIYSHKIQDREYGSDVRLDGFWGYQHLVEHLIDAGDVNSTLNSTEPLQMALHLNERIDTDHRVDCNATVRRLLQKYAPESLSLEERNYSEDLKRVLVRPPITDQIAYFCVHAQVEESADNTIRLGPSSMRLTDEDFAVTPAVLGYWTGDTTYARHPLVFLNGCQTGQMNSIFYPGLVPHFLQMEASAVIGTQTDIPAVFAGQFARRFFERFFEGGREAEHLPTNSVGQVLFDLRREFIDVYNNPLAFLYSLYRGADQSLERPVKKR